MCEYALEFLEYVYWHYFGLPYPGEPVLSSSSDLEGHTLCGKDIEVAYSLVSSLYEAGYVSENTRVVLKYLPPVGSTLSECPGIVALTPFEYNREDCYIGFSKWFFYLSTHMQRKILLQELVTRC